MYHDIFQKENNCFFFFFFFGGGGGVAIDINERQTILHAYIFNINFIYAHSISFVKEMVLKKDLSLLCYNFKLLCFVRTVDVLAYTFISIYPDVFVGIHHAKTVLPCKSHHFE